MSKESNVGLVFVGGLIAGTTIMAVGYGMSFDPELWLNQAGLAEIAIGLATLIALIIGGVQASRSYWLNRSAAHSSRFADAARMLGGDDAAVHAGIALTKDIALENPRTFGLAAIRSLTAVARSSAADLLKSVAYDSSGRPHIFIQGAISQSPVVSLEAFLAACRLYAEIDATEAGYKRELPQGRLHIQNLFVSVWSISDGVFRDIAISRSAFYETDFVRCRFHNADLVACFAGRVRFLNCDISGLAIQGTDRNGNDLLPDSLYAPSFQGCKGVEQATINGIPVTEYIAVRRQAWDRTA